MFYSTSDSGQYDWKMCNLKEEEEEEEEEEELTARRENEEVTCFMSQCGVEFCGIISLYPGDTSP